MKTNIKITPYGGTLPKHANLVRSKIQLSFLALSLFSTFSDFTHEFKLQSIHSKSEQIGGDLLLSTEKLAEKCVYRDDKILQQTCVYHENIINLVTK